MRARQILIIASVMLAACQPAAQVPPTKQAATPVDYSNAPEWVKRNPLDQKPQPQAAAPPVVVTPLPPVVVAKAEDLPEVQDGQLSVDGWKKIRIGMSLDELNAAMGTHASVDKDADYAEYNCTYLELPDKTWPSVMYVSGRVARLEVRQPGIATYGGLGVGDTAVKARAVFGGNLNEQPAAYTGLPSLFLTVWAKGGPSPDRALLDEDLAAMRKARGVRFETDDDGIITDFYAGDASIELTEGCL